MSLFNGACTDVDGFKMHDALLEICDTRYGIQDSRHRIQDSSDVIIRSPKSEIRNLVIRNFILKIALPLFIMALSIISISFSQQDTIRIQADTTLQADSTRGRITETYKPFKPTKSALLAVGLSAALPGAGQVYNETYWKVPVIWGLGGYWVYEWSKLNRSYKDYGDLYQGSIGPLDPNGNELFLKNRDFYRDERDKFAWYLGLLYFLNVVDAYVGANMYDFEVTPDLGNSTSQSLQVRANFKVRF